MSPANDLAFEISTEVRRLVDRLAVLTTRRLTEAAPPYASVAAAGHALAQRFVDATAPLEGRAPIQVLPWVDDLAVADQLSVTAYDLRQALAARSDDLAPADARPLVDLLDEVRRVRAAVR